MLSQLSYTRFIITALLLLMLFLQPCSSFAAVVHSYDATLPGQLNAIWEDRTRPLGAVDDADLRRLGRIDYLSGVNFEPSLRTRFDASFQLPTGHSIPSVAAANISIGQDLQGTGTYEIWIRDDFSFPGTVNRKIIESGANTTGFTLALRQNGAQPAELRLMHAENGVQTADFALSLDGISDEDFVQVILAFDADNDAISLSAYDAFGASVSTQVDLAADLTQIAGGNHSGLFNSVSFSGTEIGHFSGGVLGSTSGPFQVFHGEIALLQVYDSVLTEPKRVIAYNDVVVPEPSTFLLAMLGGFGLLALIRQTGNKSLCGRLCLYREALSTCSIRR